MDSYIKAEWGYNIILGAKEGINASRGVMILINNNFSCDIGQISTDPDGNFVIVELKIMEEILTHLQVFMDQMMININFTEISDKNSGIWK